MKTLLAVLVVALIHCSYAKLLIRISPIPVIAWEPVTVECLLEDSEYTMDDVRVERKLYDTWSPADEMTWGCFPIEKVFRTANSTGVTFSRAGINMFSYNRLRCVLDGPNVTTPEYAEPLNVTVHYLYGPYISSEGNPISSNTLTVKAGDDVVVKCSVSSNEEPQVTWYKEGEDWLLPTSVLTLNNVSALDEGLYTCYAEHPTLPSLSKNHTINLSVLSGLQWTLWKMKNAARFLPARDDSRDTGRRQFYRTMGKYSDQAEKWYEGSDFQILLITTSSVLVCLVVILAISAFLCTKFKTSKGPIDDHSAKKPIYKCSTESVPITCEDKQPLV